MLKEFFLNHLGKPSFGLNTMHKNAIFQIQLWFYLPPSKFSRENTVIYTMGLSQRKFHSPCPLIELSFQVPGGHARPQLEKLGFFLGEMIYDTLKVTHFTPNLILTGLKRQFMPNMKNLLVTEGAGIKPLWMEIDKSTHIRILHLLPVYDEEVSVVGHSGVWNAYINFINQGIDLFEPHRESLKDPELRPEELKLARQVDIYQKPPDNKEISQDVIQWYIHNAPDLPVAQSPQHFSEPAFSKEYFGLNEMSYALLIPVEEGKNSIDLELFWEQLYSGYYQYQKGTGLIPEPNFEPGSAETLNA